MNRPATAHGFSGFALALLFDFDGVLVNSIPAVERHWTTWAERHNLDARAVVQRAHGRRCVETIRDFVVEANLPVEVEHELAWFEQYEVSEAADLTTFAGARELLASLPLHRWAIYTACGRPLIEARLAAAGLPVPDVLITADDVSFGKPRPDGYLRAAEALGVDASSCVVVEDAPAGVAAGLAAGAQVIGITTTHSRDQLARATVIVDALEDIHVDATTEKLNIRFSTSQVDVGDS